MIDLTGGAEFRAVLKDNFCVCPAEKQTEIMVVAKDGGLKLLFVLEDDDIISYGESYNDKLYEGDVAELMITVGSDNEYIELEVNPDGVGYSALAESNENGSTIRLLWDFNFEYKVYPTTKGWATEWFVPFAELERYGFDKKNARMNLYRQERRHSGALKLQALFPTMTRTFHCPEVFGEVKF